MKVDETPVLKADVSEPANAAPAAEEPAPATEAVEDKMDVDETPVTATN